MNFDAEQVLKILHQPGVVQQTTPSFPLHQEIEIAVLARLASGDGAKNADLRAPRRSARRRISSRGPVRNEFRLSMAPDLQLHSLQPAVECFTLDAEDLRGLAFVATGGGEHFADLIFGGVRKCFDGLLARFHRG